MLRLATNSSATIAILVIALIILFGLGQRLNAQGISAQDGPVEVKYGDLFQRGELKIEPFDLTQLPPLPAGYAALDNKAYRISTTAVVAGRHTVRFAVPSVTDEDAFKKLRIFRVDNDPFDPEGHVWIDITLLKSSTAPPSFSTKTIYGQSEGLGTYVIAKLVREVPSSATIADLVVTTTGVANRITAPNLITYTIKVVNRGPDNASDVALWDGVAGPVSLVSVEPSRGSCKPDYSHIVCKLGSLRGGEAITVSVKLKPEEGRGSFPREGKEIIHDAGAKAAEKDPTPQDNEASDTILVFPDPNQPPTVTVNTPKNGALFVGPTDITLEASAEDSDGSVSQVEFFDGDISLGLGTSVDGKKFVLTTRNVSYGNHGFVAVATDNGGRIDWSVPIEVFVNGLAAVSVNSPAPDSLIAPGSDYTLTTVAIHSAGVIDKVEFVANGRSLGEAVLSDPNTYTLKWKRLGRGTYFITAVVVDGSGIRTVSAPVKFTVNKPPEVAIVAPVDSALLSEATNVSIVTQAKQVQGSIKRVDFYVDDHLIGSTSDIYTETFKFTWRNIPEGQHKLKAIAVDDLGVSETSKPVTIRVRRKSN